MPNGKHIVAKLIKIPPVESIMICVHLIHSWQFYHSFHNSLGCYGQLSKLKPETTVLRGNKSAIINHQNVLIR